MYTFVSVLIIIASIFLVILVLIQNSKGGGLAANFVSGNQTFGARQTSDFLEKGTWTLIAAVFILCIMATASIPNSNINESRSALEKNKHNLIDPNASPEFPMSMPEGGNTERITTDTSKN